MKKLAFAALAAMFVLAACAPGSSGSRPVNRQAGDVKKDVAAMGQVTLTIWDQEVRGGQEKQITTLNEQFQRRYPNVRLNRVPRSFDDLRSTLKLGLTGNDAPDVVQVNNGKQDMGAFVKAGLLLPLNGFARAYGWERRFPEPVWRLATYPDTGDVLGEGNLYGVPQTGELVGIYYNKTILAKLGLQPPKTWGEFDATLAKAKAAGVLPIQLGNLDKSAAPHLFTLGMHRFGGPDEQLGLATGRPGASWKTEANRMAAQQLLDWVGRSYLTPGFAGLKGDDSAAKFTKGEGLFHVDGTWLMPDLRSSMHDSVGFLLPPPQSNGEVSVTGGTGIPWAIGAKTKNPDAAAAYLDFITSAEAMKVQAENGGLPVFDVAGQPATGLQREVFDGWLKASSSNAMIPYLDYATNDAYEVVTGGVEQLMSGQLTLNGFLDKLQADLDASHGGR
ncbi:extracellular solute-binding protein [Amycolatopsis sp. H20-H5]|uniref:extracellular solute-binding protein n=1 Tax=Amycolatopsis sp. H20-H5 TaxID=3046309 RepID=UPI002DB7AFBD|nr:extracellular solute-binding protein [Amycolatopsis sp. H20-H5]MEC3978993.1 extracellular solute-binding protein [Amycolatopsis sp. H20-H5]